MGFGYLFIGYFLLLGFTYTDVFAGAVMFGGMRPLTRYCPDNRPLSWAKLILWPFTVISGAIFVIRLLHFCKVSLTLPEVLLTVLQGITMTLLMLFTLFLMLGIRKLALEVGLPKIASRAVTCLTMCLILWLLRMLGTTGIYSLIGKAASLSETFPSYVNMILVLADFVRNVITLVLLYSCYMRICLEGDESMEPTREDLFDRMLSKLSTKKK